MNSTHLPCSWCHGGIMAWIVARRIQTMMTRDFGKRQYGFNIKIGGKVYRLYRDVATSHPKVIHRALGTSSEIELQRVLDGVNVADWFDQSGHYLGRDVSGIGVIELG